MRDGQTGRMSEKPEEKRDPPKKRRRFGRIALVLTLVLALIGLPLFALSLTGASIKAPQWLADQIENRMNQEIAPANVTLSGIEIGVDRGFRPKVRMTNVGVFDQQGYEIGRLNEVRSSLLRRGLVQGDVAMRSVSFSGAQIVIRRNRDGTFALSFGAGGPTEAQGNIGSIFDAFDLAFTKAPLDELESLDADQLTITLEDSRTGRFWQVTEGTISLKRAAEGLDLTIAADVFNGTEEFAQMVAGIQSDADSGAANITLTFENAAAADIAAQSPALAFLGVLDAQISGALRTEIDDNGDVAGFVGSLRVGAGAVQPTDETPPIEFESGQAYVEYDPRNQSLQFSRVSVQSQAGAIKAEGQAFLQDWKAGWPETMVGQLAVSDVRLQPRNIFAKPMTFSKGMVDLRLRLDPFSIDLGQVALQEENRRFGGKGRISADDAGWNVALDLDLNAITLEQALDVWPVAIAPGARDWLGKRVLHGQVTDLSGAFRLVTDQEPQLSVSFAFDDGDVLVMPTLPPVQNATGYASVTGKTFTLVVEDGVMTAPNGGDIQVAGSVFRVPDVTLDVGVAEITLDTDGPLLAALSLLDLKPFELMTRADLPVDLAEGRALVDAFLTFDLVREVNVDDIDYQVNGELRNVSSTKLMEGRTIRSDRLFVEADPNGITIKGDGLLDALPVSATWRQNFGESNSQVVGTVALGEAFTDAFDIALPQGSITGNGIANMTLDLVDGEAPRFSLKSDLNRVGLRLDAMGWVKPRNQTGSFEVTGRLGDVPAIDRLSINAAGLRASGVIDLGPNGALRTAQFDRVRLGGWLDGPVTLTGRGAGRAPAVEIRGGTVDLRNSSLESSGESGPMSLSLDRLQITENIALTNFRGSFKGGSGLDGSFTGRVNGQAPIEGTIVPTPQGGAVRISSANGGATLAAADILDNGRGGHLSMTLAPRRGGQGYDGVLKIDGMRFVRTPALAELLSAISIVGIIEQMNAGGIHLSNIDAEFTLTSDRMTLYFLSAVGPSLGISLDGIYDMKRNTLDMQGVISPVYFLNAIGQIFSRGKEGLFGFAYSLRGSAEDPRISVNPLSILTPGAFREIFRRPPPKPVPSQ